MSKARRMYSWKRQQEMFKWVERFYAPRAVLPRKTAQALTGVGKLHCHRCHRLQKKLTVVLRRDGTWMDRAYLCRRCLREAPVKLLRFGLPYTDAIAPPELESSYPEMPYWG